MYVPLGEVTLLWGNLHDRECIGTSFPQAGHNKFLGPFQRIIAHLLSRESSQGSARLESHLESPRVIFVGPNLLVLYIL